MENYSYNPITREIADSLRAIVGDRYVIFGDADKLEPFSHDEIPDPKYAHMPDCLVRPRTAEEISQIIKLANRENFPVTPRGAGSGLSGGAVPVFGGVVLLCDRMNKILEIDSENMCTVVEPGVVTSELCDAVAEKNLFFAGYPMSSATCCIAGNVAENAGGGKAVKYGVTGRYVMGMQIVTPTGDIVNLGGKLVKNVTGYDLLQLMIASEGTLGVFTEIILRLLPLPSDSVDLLVLFSSTEQAIDTAVKIPAQSGIVPTGIEFMDSQSVRASCEYLNESLPWEGCGAMLLITLDGSDAEQVERHYESIGELCMDCGAIEVYVADNFTTSQRLWNVRKNMGEAFNLAEARQSNEDVVVPPAQIPQAVKEFELLADKYGVRIPCYGHAGDGNLHARIINDGKTPIDDWDGAIGQILRELYDCVKKLGGTISGEHGIGHKRKPYMEKFCSPVYLDMLRAIKKSLDPKNILNPGKIFEI